MGRIAFNEIEWKLEGLKQPRFQGFHCRRNAVRRNAYKTDFPGIAGLGNGLVSPLGSQHLLESVCIGYVVKLVNVDPVGLKLPQRQLKVIRSTLGVSLGGFSGDDDLVSGGCTNNCVTGNL